MLKCIVVSLKSIHAPPLQSAASEGIGGETAAVTARAEDEGGAEWGLLCEEHWEFPRWDREEGACGNLSVIYR